MECEIRFQQGRHQWRQRLKLLTVAKPVRWSHILVARKRKNEKQIQGNG